MRDEPDAGALLTIARKTLLEDVLPEVSGAQRYNTLMVAAAMAIVQRELESDGGAPERERDGLLALVGAATGGETSLISLNRRFAAEIRAGNFDSPGPGRDAAENLLRESTLARLGECNPRYLEDE